MSDWADDSAEKMVDLTIRGGDECRSTAIPMLASALREAWSRGVLEGIQRVVDANDRQTDGVLQ